MKKVVQIALAGLVASVMSASNLSAASIFELHQILEKPSQDAVKMPLILINATNTYEHVFTVEKAVLMDQKMVKSAKELAQEKTGKPVLELTFTETGKKQFAKITAENKGHRLGFVIGGKLCFAPTIKTEITAGRAQMVGSLTEQDAKDLAKKINDAVK